MLQAGEVQGDTLSHNEVRRHAKKRKDVRGESLLLTFIFWMYGGRRDFFACPELHEEMFFWGRTEDRTSLSVFDMNCLCVCDMMFFWRKQTKSVLWTSAFVCSPRSDLVCKGFWSWCKPHLEAEQAVILTGTKHWHQHTKTGHRNKLTDVVTSLGKSPDQSLSFVVCRRGKGGTGSLPSVPFK